MQRASLAFGILLSGVVLVDCGSKMLGSDDLGSEASGVVTAGNAIVPTQATSTITPGEAAGEFSVTESGQASYTVPLWTPEGPMGMSPSLALHYDSSGGSGPLGMGFSLAGNVISMITRCRKTIAIDGDVSSIEVGGSTFCLDGRRLVPTSTVGEYRTQVDDGSKIVRIGLDTAGQPTGWTVYLRNGQILTYGAKADFSTQLRGTVKITTCTTGGCTPQAFLPQTAVVKLAWALEKVTDRVAQIPNAIGNGVGNYMTISYTTFSSGTTPVPKYSTDFDFKEMLISQIDYGYGTGTTAHRQVKFTYDPTKTRDDARYTWISGVPIMSTKLLTKIEMLGPNPTPTQPNPTTMSLLKMYRLGYDTVLGVSGRTRLELIQECDNAATPVCKKFTQFHWENGSIVFRDVVDPTPRAVGLGSPLQVLDFNGDGKSDLMISTPTDKVDPTAESFRYFFYTSQMGPELALPGSPSPSAPVRLEPGNMPSGYEYRIRDIAPIDIDHDGRSDLAMIGAQAMVDKDGTITDTNHVFDIWRNIGNGYGKLPLPTGGNQYDNAGTTFTPAMYADLDGDGLPEEIGPGITKANNPANSNRPDYSQLLFRHNNPGGVLNWRAALNEGNQSYTSLTSVLSTPMGDGRHMTYTGNETYAIDIDGSGRQALLIWDSSFDVSQPAPYVNVLNQYNQMRAVQMTRGGVVTSKLPALPAYHRGINGFHYIWLDVNGDGLPDAIAVPNDITDGTVIAKCSDVAPDISRIQINTGAGFKNYSGASTEAYAGAKYAVNARTDAGVAVGDIDEDGLDDIVLMGKAATRTGADGGAVTSRATMQMLVARSGVTSSAHLVGGLPLLTLDGQEIPTVDSGVYPAVNHIYDKDTGVPAVLGDFNGDGLIDMAVLRRTQSGDFLHFYIHQGQKADMLKSVDTGTGRHIEIKYAPIADPAVYHRMRTGQPTPGQGVTGAWEQPTECQWPASCATGGLWVVSRYDVTNDQKVNVGRHMTYAEGRTVRGDRWLGFAERWDYDEVNGVVDVTTYDNRTPGASEHYPFAALPAQQVHIARDNGGPPATSDPHRFVTTNHYQEVANVFASAAYSARLTDTGTVEEILNDTPPATVDYFALNNDYASDQLANATTTFTYDQYDNLKREQRVNAMGQVLDKTYNPTSNPSVWLMNLVGSMTETSSNNITGEQVSRSRSYTYYTNTLLLNTETIVGAAGVGSVTTYTRGAGGLGQVTQRTITATSTPDDTSVPTGTTLTRTETTTYDAVDGVTVASTTNALNQQTLYAYHGGLGVVAQTQDPNGVITSFQYDTFGRLRKRTVPTAGDYTMSYEAPPTFPSLISSIVSTLGPVYAEHSTQVGDEETIVTYNMNGNELVRQIKAGDGAYRYVLTRYNSPPGQVASVSLPFRSTDSTLRLTSFNYDSFGRKLETIHPDASKQTSYCTPRFGPLGYVKTTIDELNHQRDEAYNDDGQIASVTEYVGGTPIITTYDYGPFALLKNVSPPNVVSSGGAKGAGNSITYDVLGRRLTYTEGDGGPNTRSYNGFGDVVKEVDATGTPTYFKRDALGRVTSRSNALDGANANMFVWDTAARGTTGGQAIGKLASTTSFDGTGTSYIYDNYARPSVTTWGIQARAYQMKQTYTTAGKVAEIDYPTTASASTQLKVTYGYDSAGGVSSITKVGAPTPYWKATRWWADGRIDQENDATNMMTTWVFDNNRTWPNSITTAAGSVTIQNVTYGHDLAGNVTSRSDTDSAVNTTEGFTYDEVNKLKKWTFTSGSNTWTTDYTPGGSGVIQQTKTGTGAQSLAYDYFGDATSQLPHAVRKVNGGCATGGLCYMPTYDAKGRAASTSGGYTVSYTTFDLPKTIASGSIQTTFSYDANNRRAYKDYAVIGIAGSDHTVTSYVADLYERRTTPAGVVSHVMFIRGPGNRVVAQETWTESGTSVTASPVLYYHDDIIGSTVVTNTAATSASATRLRYDPFGLRISPTNPTQAPASPPTRIGYTGHEMDDDLNLINMKGRIYDPKTARFLTPDPMVSAPNNGNGYDRYGYAGNNPMKYTDPSGFTYNLSDQWLMSQGYDIGFIDFMYNFNEHVEAKIRFEIAKKEALAYYAKNGSPQSKDRMAIVNAAALVVKALSVKNGVEYATIVYGVKNDKGEMVYSYAAPVTDNNPVRSTAANAEPGVPSDAVKVAIVHGHPDVDFIDAQGNPDHSMPEVWNDGLDSMATKGYALRWNQPRLDNYVVTAGGRLMWQRLGQDPQEIARGF